MNRERFVVRNGVTAKVTPFFCVYLVLPKRSSKQGSAFSRFGSAYMV